MHLNIINIASIFSLIITTTTAQCPLASTLCSPPGATSLTPPQLLDPNFSSLYKHLLQSSLPTFSSKSKRFLELENGNALVQELEPRQGSTTTSSLCCTTSLSCLLIATLNIPFCYDLFTTNYFLPDNSFGTLSSGSYKAISGAVADLQKGEYTLASGEKGDFYSQAEEDEVSGIAKPKQFTGTGVGSAVPASALGGVVVRTYTRTVEGSTVPASTITGGVSTITLAGGTSVTTTTILGSTRVATTIPGSETVITTTERVAASATDVPSATASTSTKSAAGQVGVGIGLLGGCFSLVLYLL